MEQGSFREDLYYRLNTFHLHLPPLRERRVVIPTLVRYFVLKNQEATGKEIKIAASKAPKFKAGAVLKKAVKSFNFIICFYNINIIWNIYFYSIKEQCFRWKYNDALVF